MNEYVWAKARPSGVSAQIFGEAAETIVDQTGGVRPKDMVDLARSKRHPLHVAYEWDNAIAGEEHRLHQASEYLRSLSIRRLNLETQRSETRRGFVSVVRLGDDRPSYVPRLVVLSDDDLYAQAIENMNEELYSAKRRMEELMHEREEVCNGYAPIVAAINELKATG
jgi:hypothetical protein